MDKSELCINLWFCFNKETGFVDAIAGRGYFLNGSDEQKTAALKILASSDFKNVVWQTIPNRYQTKIVRSVNSESKSFSGIVHSSDIDILGLDLFEEVFKKIESVNQIYIPIKNTGAVKVPDEPLYVITPVEYSNGIIKAIIG